MSALSSFFLHPCSSHLAENRAAFAVKSDGRCEKRPEYCCSDCFVGAINLICHSIDSLFHTVKQGQFQVPPSTRKRGETMCIHYRTRSGKRWMSRELHLCLQWPTFADLLQLQLHWTQWRCNICRDDVTARSQGTPCLLLNVIPEGITLTSVTTYSMSSVIQGGQFCLHSTPSTTPQISSSSYPATSKELVIVSNFTSSLSFNSYPDASFLLEIY